jgi:hypothetical protein
MLRDRNCQKVQGPNRSGLCVRMDFPLPRYKKSFRPIRSSPGDRDILRESYSTRAGLAPIPMGKSTFAFTVEIAAENLEPVPVGATSQASPLVAIFAQGESLIRGFMTDTILMEIPQVDPNRMALIQRWCIGVRIVESVVCAAFQAIAVHARSDRADDESGAGLQDSPAVLHRQSPFVSLLALFRCNVAVNPQQW